MLSFTFLSIFAYNTPDVELCNETKEYNARIFAQIKGIAKYNGIGAQGFATFGNVGFCFYDSGYCKTIDLNNKMIISSFMLPEGVANSNNHCGVACFSDTFFNQEDKYPLLYLSSYKEYTCYVLRMTETNAELVQVIQMKDDNENVVPIYAFMPDGNKLILKSNYPHRENGVYKYIWKIINRPEISTEINSVLYQKDVTNSFSVFSSDLYNAGFCKNNRIYQLAGYGGFGSKKLYIIDYNNGVVLKEIIWQEDFLYNKEQEQCSPYGNDGMLINYHDGDYISYIQFLNFSYEDVPSTVIANFSRAKTVRKKFLRKGKAIIDDNDIKYDLNGIYLK